MRTLFVRFGRWPAVVLGSLLALACATARAQTPPPAWGQAAYFRYQIENVVVAATAAGRWDVQVIFSVVNPTTGEVWDIKNALPYQSAGASLTLDIGWDGSTDFTNTGSANPLLNPIVTTALGAGAALPVQVRNLHSNAGGASRCLTTTDCPGIAELYNRFWVRQSVSPVAFVRAVATGRVALEGHPVCNGFAGCPPGPPYAAIPVRSEVADFAFVSSTSPVGALIADPRRQVVDFDGKCTKCHNGTTLSGSGTPIPRLSLHGSNRNENLKLCVMCHNPNQTDVPYRMLSADPRTSGPETPLDFKRMVHAIHAGGFRETPFVVIGFNTSINDFSGVRFPARLSNCVNCHFDDGRRGTFELPLKPTVLGTTVKTGSVYAVPAGATRTIDVNPSNDAKITPTAATCSACHDKADVRSHMVRTGGASFSTTQGAIGTSVVERCVNCHGPGKEQDVRRAHEISGSGGGSLED